VFFQIDTLIFYYKMAIFFKFILVLSYLLASLLFVATELKSLLLNKYFEIMNRLGCKIQSVLTSAVYAKVWKKFILNNNSLKLI
jgi:hypothetical protein